MRTHQFCAAIVGVALTSAALTAAAQTNVAGKWEIEIYAGSMRSANPSAGTISLPGPGEPFLTATSNPSPPPPSRRQSSWYFGDGPVLFNEAVAALFTQAAAAVGPPARIATLDPVLARSLTEPPAGGNVGARVSRALNRKMSAEIVFDYGLASQTITQANRDAIEVTRASFGPAFSGMITFNPNRVLNSVASTAEIQNGGRHQLATSGLLTINLKTTGQVVPYASAGVGVIAITGSRPTAILRGGYQFLLPDRSPINETDTVTVRDARDENSVVGILAGGLKYYARPRWGIRLDARVLLGKNGASTSVDAAPAVALGMQPAGRGVLGGSPSIQFTNNSSDPVTALGMTAVAASTLTGPVVSGLQTFSGTGVARATSVTAGVFWRF